MDRRRTGILLYVAAWAIVPVMDACAKTLGNLGYPVLMIVWARFAMSFIMLLPLLLGPRRSAFHRPADLSQQGFRVVLLVAATLGYFQGLQSLPLADALAIYFVYPFLITAFAPIVLGEIPGVRRWAAIGVGFMGSLLVIRPGFGEVPPGAGYVLAAAAAFAGYNLLTRRVAGDGGHWQVLVFQMLAGTLLTTPLLMIGWHTPDAFALMLFAGMGLASVGGHYLLIRAYQFAPAPVLAPFSYFEIISATVLGFAVFGDFPDKLTWAGVAIIAASGIYIGFRERRMKPDEI